MIKDLQECDQLTEQEIEPPKGNIAVKNVAEYLDAIKDLIVSEYGKFAFRGQGDISHPIRSTAARRLGFTQSQSDSFQKFINYNCDLISNAKLKGYDKKGNRTLEELELMAELQHHGAATALIDFTYSSLVALYFASVNDPGKDGVVYVINIHDFDKFQKIDSDNSGWKFEKYLEEEKDHLWVWEPSDLNNRIPKQHSLFIFGEPDINDKSIKSVRINADYKSQILSELQDLHDIGGLTLFNDMVGFASENCCEKPYYSKEYLKHMNKAKSMWVIGDCNKGEILEHVEEALKINPISYEALIFCADIKHQLKDYPSVIEICNRILDNNSDYAIALFLRANSYYEMGQLEYAKRDIRRSFEIRQDNPHAALLFMKLN
ncbi:FRG domain-containing protein [Methanogenium sp. MK-MG]|uniref:FRG domain-containing protein n=1 Tax=Methanogenium sp. MK-MG TaxID=2599926 RepID=UPI0013EB7206|nr:FRG domain-containing protein [Methanogenium sp. MK-MG]KAF1076400.1 hypothetical protein MKMG_01506 [Methanogenium sp. MK-MG]